MMQPACVTLRYSTGKKTSGYDQCDLECNLKPLELTYRQRTLSNLSNLLSILHGNTRGGDPSTQDDRKVSSKESDMSNDLHLTCNLSSITLNFPLLEEDDFSTLYTRCSKSLNGSSVTGSSIGVVLDQVSLEYNPMPVTVAEGVGHESELNETTSFECNSFLLFATSPDNESPSLARKMYRMDIVAASGLLEVEPCIPIAIQYRQNDIDNTEGDNHGRKTFPVVPALSSFKARQEDEDEDDEIDRILSAKLQDVEIDTRRSLRAKDPQCAMQDAAGKCGGVIQVHIPDIVCDLTADELCAVMRMMDMIKDSDSKESNSYQSAAVSSSSLSTSSSPPLALSLACDAVTISVHSKGCPSSSSLWEDDETESSWNSHVLRLDRCRLHTIVGGEGKQIRFLSRDVSFFEGKSIYKKIYYALHTACSHNLCPPP